MYINAPSNRFCAKLVKLFDCVKLMCDLGAKACTHLSISAKQVLIKNILCWKIFKQYALTSSFLICSKWCCAFKINSISFLFELFIDWRKQFKVKLTCPCCIMHGGVYAHSTLKSGYCSTKSWQIDMHDHGIMLFKSKIWEFFIFKCWILCDLFKKDI